MFHEGREIMRSILLLLWLLPGSFLYADTLPRLLAHYELNNNFSDSSGNDYHLTSLNPNNPFSADVHLKESDNSCFGPITAGGQLYGAVGPVLPLDKEKGFTICGFASMPQQNSYHAVPFGCGKSDYSKPGALIYAPWGVIHTKAGDITHRQYERLADGKWHHYALVAPPIATGEKRYHFYIDGEEVYDSVYQPLNNFGNFVLGKIEGAQCVGFKIDEVKVFDGALSPVQIKSQAEMTGVRQPKRDSAHGVPRRIPPREYNFPVQGEVKIHFLTEDWICIVGNYNDFMRERIRIECGNFLRLLDEKVIAVPEWSYDFHYNFSAIEVISDYRPRIKQNYDNPDYFSLTDDAGEKIKWSRHGYWINAVGQMRVPTGSGNKEKMLNSVEVAHFTYLQLSEPLQNGRSYQLTTSNGEVVDFTYDDHHVVSQAIKVNQVGYLPDAGRKYAYLGSWLGSAGPLPLKKYAGEKFHLINRTDGKPVFTGVIRLRSKEQYYTGDAGMKVPLNGEEVYELDFSGFDIPGAYHIYVPGVGRSRSFAVSRDAIGRAFYWHIRGLYHQRSGIAKGPPYTRWPMGAGHLSSWIGGFSPEISDYQTTRDDGYGYLDQDGESVKLKPFDVVRQTATDQGLPKVHGGWWDAADFDRRPMHFRVVEDLLAAYLMFPDNFSDGQQDIPESGNGIPDIIDEAAWGVNVWLRAQAHNPKGGVGCWLEADSHPREYDPAKDAQRYYLALPTRNSTIQYAAHAALLARAYRQCGAKKLSETYLDSAGKAFDYAVNPANLIVYHWEYTPPGSDNKHNYTFREPPELDEALVFKAALNLYLLTNKEKYRAFADRRRFDIALQETAYPKTPFSLAELLGHEQAFPDYVRDYQREMLRQTEQWLGWQEQLAYRNLNWPTDHPFFKNIAWGNAIPFNKGRYFIVAYRITGNKKYRDAALLLNDWVCGANPMGRTLTTGLGQNFPVRVLSLPSYADGIAEPLPGLTQYTFTFWVEYQAKKMVYALNYPARSDHEFSGVNICLMPDAMTQGKEISLDAMGKLMDEHYPVWRRFNNIEAYGVSQNEFSVWETIGPAAAFLGCLLPPDWRPPPEWKNIKPTTKLEQMEGYIFHP